MPIGTILQQKEDAVRVPVKIWSREVEDSALQQLKNTARLPFVFHHVAAMADVHFGMGATIGSVVATKGAIVPAAVGVDIGCGMMAVKTPLKIEQVGQVLPELRAQIERSVPVGFGQNGKLRKSVEDWDGWNSPGIKGVLLAHNLLEKAAAQLGSLGGGNHFIEVCGDELGAVWVMLHSGSRGAGNRIARVHVERAKGLMRRMFIDLPDPDLAYFAMESEDGRAYMRDLDWLQGYAMQNRVEMMDRVLDQLGRLVRPPTFPMERLVEVNCHHNYAVMEHHFGENVLVTRKGAVRARAGDMGIIPGSMGTRSYIVRGLGNPESFDSCSHGAGRRMSRTQARKTFTVKDLEAQTAGVECRKDDGVLDEIPGAYKDIDVVMENQADLVEIVATLKQVLCVKG